MKIDLGLPVDDTRNLIGWARRADAGPFSTVAVLGACDTPWPTPGP